ncbi:hypothetical protein P7K49_035033 [Saguinus oedipus]|uniref:Uncharacterized protein n=1 Tax=Saguinus oedipus TaxID=9490 RepID=A0ABQ9TWE1_SAGOE|nr:hypothetical protein P7K49_035033 [Saguinus oedipus]
MMLKNSTPSAAAWTSCSRFFSSTSCTHLTVQRTICSRSTAHVASASRSASRSRVLSSLLGDSPSRPLPRQPGSTAVAARPVPYAFGFSLAQGLDQAVKPPHQAQRPAPWRAHFAKAGPGPAPHGVEVAQALEGRIPEQVGGRRRIRPTLASRRRQAGSRRPQPLAGVGPGEGPALGQLRRRWHRVEGATAAAGDFRGGSELQNQRRLKEAGRGSREKAGLLGETRRESGESSGGGLQPKGVGSGGYGSCGGCRLGRAWPKKGKNATFTREKLWEVTGI